MISINKEILNNTNIHDFRAGFVPLINISIDGTIVYYSKIADRWIRIGTDIIKDPTVRYRAIGVIPYRRPTRFCRIIIE